MATKYLDSTGLALLWEKIKNGLSGKVDKATGKGLSSNDYTSDEKTKLANIASGAQVNVLEGIQKNGTTVTVTNKIANISVPTATSQLTNDSGFITSSDLPDGAAASTTTPKMDGTATVGTETTFARGDHIHPSDTTKVDIVPGKGLSTNDYTDADKDKLSGIAAGAEVNQNAFSNVKVGSTTVAADAKTDTLELAAGSYITLTPDATNDKVTIKVNGTTSATPDSTDLITSGAVYSGLANKVNTSSIGAANGVCPLNGSSKIDSTYLPSYVDDVVEAYARSGQTALSSTWLATGSASGTVITPETGVIYILMADSGNYTANTQFRWGGTAYVKMADGGVSAITETEINTICV